MKFTTSGKATHIAFDEADERIVWQIVAVRLKNSQATLRDEFIKTVEEIARVGRQLREDPVQRRRPNGEIWTFGADDDGRLHVTVEGGE